MRRLVGMSLLVILGSGAGLDTESETRPERYQASLLKLASAASAKETCSCVFVMGRDEDFCRSWMRVKPDVARFRVDYEAKRVKSRALFVRSQARYLGPREGCVLEP